ncbi:MAG: hypothetical protein AAF846_07900 [Chloroflexota bacterium]
MDTSTLIESLIAFHIEAQNSVNGFTFERATEGANGIVYRVIASNDVVYAVKIARKSPRKRAWREFTITNAIHNQGIHDICPRPLALILKRV